MRAERACAAPYMVFGRGFCLGQGVPWSPRDGIHVIETAHWTEIAQSVRRSDPKDFFSYDYDPTCSFCGLGGGTHTPEG